MTRSDIRTRIRDYLYESSADLWTNDQLNRCIDEEMRSLPSKNIYIEDRFTTSEVQDQTDYTLPTGTFQVDKVERNEGTSSIPNWVEINGWDTYGNVLVLPARPSGNYTLRASIRKYFTILTDDSTATDVPDDTVEVLVVGSSLRAYRMLMGFFVDAKNWDAVGKPDAISMNQVQNWIIETRRDYRDLVRSMQTMPIPREINLVS